MKKIALIGCTAALAALSGCGTSGPPTEPLAASVVTTASTAPTTTTTEVPTTTTTTTLPAPPTFVILCPAATKIGYFGKPAEFTVGYQGGVNTESSTLDISWGDGKAARFTSLDAFSKHRGHAYGPGDYQVSALLTDAYGRTASSNCNISWVDSLPATMHRLDCTMRGNAITTYAPGGAYGFQQPTRTPDPSCAYTP